MKYIFKSARLGFRNWQESDLKALAEINADEEVMEFFPHPLSEQETTHFIRRMQKQFAEKGFCYFAVEKLEDKEMIGFIGLSEQDFGPGLTPFIDIGWRLKRSAWNKGYATEGARACLHFAFTHLKVGKVYAIAPEINKKSVTVMRRVGMEKEETFYHPKLIDNERLQSCVLYVKHKRREAIF